MSSPSHTTPRVPVPRSAADYSPKVQDPDLRSEVNAILLQHGHVAKYASKSPSKETPSTNLGSTTDENLYSRIQNHLTQTLAASPSNWSQKISTHALDLIRSGECTTFPTLMERIMEDVKRDTENARRASEKKSISNGNGEALASREVDNGSGLAVPKVVEEEGFRITRQCLESVVEMTE